MQKTEELEPEEKLLTIREAAEITELSKETIRNYIKSGRLRSTDNEEVTKVYLSEIEDLKRSRESIDVKKDLFDGFILEKGDSLKPLNCFRVGNGGAMYTPLKYKTSQRYMISCYGRIFNIDRNKELTPFKVADGRLQVELAQFGNTVPMFVHRLVARVWCDNVKSKQYVHHIDGDKLNNRADNLIWVTEKEHGTAHKLLNTAKETGDFTEYNNYISQINNDNYCEENCYCVFDHSYGEGDKRWFIFQFVTEKGYQALKNGEYDIEHIPPWEMIGEAYDRNLFFAERVG